MENEAIDGFLAKNTIPSAQANGKQKKGPAKNRNEERSALHDGIRGFSKAKVTSASEASAVLSQANMPSDKSMDPNIPGHIANKSGKKMAGSRKTRKERARSNIGLSKDGAYDPFSGQPPEDGVPDDIDWRGESDEAVEENLFGGHTPQTRTVIKEVIKKVEVVKEVRVPSKADNFLAQSRRITIKTNDGMFMLPAVDLKTSADCITLLLPLSEDSTTYIPNRGSELTIIWREDNKDRKEKVFFPGTCVEVQELGVIIVSLIIIDDK